MPEADFAIPPPSDFHQTIRFIESGDGTSIAYATAGEGIPVVRTSH
ncbi:MAG: hypothetical protein R3E48_09300 [Burkholderiaceae bacterium]